MRLFLRLALLSGGITFAQGTDCATLEQCRKAIDRNPKSSQAHYRQGEILFRNGEWDLAAAEFREALRGDLKPQWTEVWSHIYAGRTYDLTNQRARATNEYRLVLRMNGVSPDAKQEAAGYIESPYRLR